jgi:hypothetical protein
MSPPKHLQGMKEAVKGAFQCCPPEVAMETAMLESPHGFVDGFCA